MFSSHVFTIICFSMVMTSPMGCGPSVNPQLEAEVVRDQEDQESIYKVHNSICSVLPKYSIYVFKKDEFS